MTHTLKNLARPARRQFVAAAVAIAALLGSAMPAQALATVPSAPADAVAYPFGSLNGETSLMVTWLAPLQFADSAYVYQVQYTSNQGTTWQSISDVPAPFTNAAINQLTAGASYTVRVRAVDGAGNSSPWTIASSKMDRFVQIASGGTTSCGLHRSGGVMCWGSNAAGAVGDGTFINRYFPVFVQGLTNVKSVTVGSSHACAVLADGSMWCWGENGFGQLGDGTTTTSNVPRVVSGISGAVAASAGLSHTCAVDSSGSIFCWGRNADGQLGTGTTVSANTPAEPISGITNAIGVTAGNSHTCALLATKAVSCWGDNTYGQLGDGTTNRRLTPTAVPGLSLVRQVEVGTVSSCAVGEDQSLRCWGANTAGQVGDSSNTNRPSPTPVTNISTATSVSVGDGFACARLADGSANCWGYNVSGQLGDGTTDNSNRPIAVASLSTAADISAGGVHVCALLDDQTLSCWGGNNSGQVGSGFQNQSQAVPSGLHKAGIVTIVTGYSTHGRYSHSCALLGDGRVACWGNNVAGQTGDGTIQSPALPGVVPGLTDVVSIAAGADHTCAVKANGSVWCWGSNFAGQLGTGDLFDSSSPVQARQYVSPTLSAPIADAASVEAHANNTCIVRDNGEVACWGANTHSQVGRLSTDTPDTVVSDPVTRTDIPAYWTARNVPGFGGVGRLNSVQQLALGTQHACALLDDTTAWCWGANDAGELGNNCDITVTPTCESPFPVDNGGFTGTSIAAGDAHTCLANATTGTLYCWGKNTNGQIGNNDLVVPRVPVLSPTAVFGIGAAGAAPANAAVDVVAGAEHTCAVMADATLQCWGSNSTGQLGRSYVTTPRSVVPLVVPGLSKVELAAAGTYHTCTVSTVGTVACWGYDGPDPLVAPIGSTLLKDTVGAGAFGNAILNSSPITLGAVPSVPQDVQGLGDNAQVLVSWIPSNANGALVTKYTVVSNPDNRTCMTSGSSQCIVSGLTNGQAYTFTVVATNLHGDSAASSASAAVTPLGVPAPPLTVTAIAADGVAQVSWLAPSNNGGLEIEGYDVFIYANGILQETGGCSTAPTVFTCQITGLSNGTNYTFTVRATNSLGQSLESVPSAAVVPSGIPTKVTNITVSRTTTTATVSWISENGNGAAVVSYHVSASDAGGTCTNIVGVSPVANSCTITGLTAGVAYKFSVTATNANGSSPAVLTGAAGVATPTFGDTAATLAWTAATAGDYAIVSYEVVASPGNHVCTTLVASESPLTCSVSGLTNGVTYSLSVFAIDAMGNRAGSVPVSVVPAGKPFKATGVVVTRSGTSATISWAAADNNGQPITAYSVNASPGFGKFCLVFDTTCTITGLTLTDGYTFSVTASNALGDSAARVVAAPSQLVATRGDGQVSFTWNAATGGDAPVASYKVQSSDPDFSCVTLAADPRSCTITGLTNGTQYSFVLTATDTASNTAQAVAATAVPATIPTAVSQPTAVSKDQSATVSWVAPSNNGDAITSYTVTASDPTKSCTTSTTTCDVTGLTNGSSYTFTVVATNAVGSSTSSPASAEVVPAGVPLAPTTITADARIGEVTVSWSAADANGRALTGYTVSSNVSGVGCTTAADVRSCVISGLTNGTSYTFTVTATNAIGTSASSTASAPAIPAGVPSAPTNVSAAARDRAITVSWSAANGNGGEITGYTVTSNVLGVGCTAAGNVQSCDVTNLTNGFGYTFTVTATNAAGTSTPSATSAPAIPAGPPSAPTNLVATAGDRNVTLTWAASGGSGAAVTGYTVTSNVSGVGCSVPAADLRCVITGLTNGTSYTFQLVANSAPGASTQVTAVSKPFGKPTAVTTTKIQSVVAKKTLNLTVRGATSNGSAITGYLVKWAFGTSTKYTGWKSIKANGAFSVTTWPKNSTIKIVVATVNAAGQTFSKVFTLKTPK